MARRCLVRPSRPVVPVPLSTGRQHQHASSTARRGHWRGRHPQRGSRRRGGRHRREAVGHRVFPRDSSRLSAAPEMAGAVRGRGQSGSGRHRLLWGRTGPLPGVSGHRCGRGEPPRSGSASPARQVRPCRCRGRRSGCAQRRRLRFAQGRRRSRRGDPGVAPGASLSGQSQNPGDEPNAEPDRHSPRPTPMPSQPASHL